jgi:uncharacterized protein (TIGR03000 family)
MVRQRLLGIAAPLCAVAALLFAGNTGFAQHHGGGGGGGHSGGSWHGGGGEWHGGNGGWNNGGWNNGGWGRGYYGWGLGLGFGYPYYGYGYGYPSYYGGYGYSYPYTNDYGYNYPYGNSANSNSMPSGGYEEAEQPANAQGVAHIRVLAPTDAKVWFNGVETTQTGTERFFATPTLEPGRSYTYQVRSEGGNGAKSRQVSFHAGDAITVDLR